MTTPTCPSCRITMEIGFTVDHAHAGIPEVAKWTAGAPERSFWGLKIRGRQRLEIVSYRCPKCGLLQSYAPQV